jgi:hypothetical protein
MLNILLFIGAVGFVSWQLAIFFNDVWLRDAQHKKLRQKFEDWWLTVVDLDRLKLALVCTIKLNGILNRIFGENLFSRRAFWRTSIAATGFLIASLALIGFLNHDIFGVKPWENYKKTADAVMTTIPSLQAQYKESAKPSLVTNALPAGADIDLYRKNNPGVIITNNNVIMLVTNTAAADFSLELEKVKQVTMKYNTTSCCAVYSVTFMVILVFLNALLCFFSLVISRLILREMIAAARPFSTLALLVTNLFLVVNVSSVFLLFLTILNTPIVWLFLPVILLILPHSFSVYVLVFFGGELASWIFSSPALKLVALIALLPFIFTLSVSMFSYTAMLWRNLFHKCVSSILLRCAEKGPLTVIVITSALVASLIGGLGKLIHFYR